MFDKKFKRDDNPSKNFEKFKRDDNSFKNFEKNEFDSEDSKDFKKNKDFSKFKKDKMPSKDLAKLKKARIIIRNIPFGITTEQLNEAFGKYGEIHETIIPKTDDGKMKGFAFINFKKTMFAIRAVNGLNGKELSSDKYKRTIKVELAMNKNKYINHVYSLKKIDLLNNEEGETKQEEKQEENQNDDNKQDEDETSEDSEEENDDSEDDLEKEEDVDSEKDDDVEESLEKKKLKHKNKFIDEEEKPKKFPKKSKDVEEGKTLFIRNLSYGSTREDLEELMQEFGELEYCLICVDKVTEHSKGTAFVKFKNKKDADDCLKKFENLEENEELFYLDGRVLDLKIAISKENIDSNKKENEKLRDKRNLFLTKEGLIYPDSVAAQDVSAEDLKKRLVLSQNKKKQLENLSFFVSKNRLCFHNIPQSYTDNDLRKLCLNQLKGEKDVKILFCKIMKNKNAETNNFSTSKGFGFVSFSQHRHALKVLRALNNNPDTFTKNRRPIIEFSIENLNAIKKNHQFIIKESRESGLELETVTHPWAGFQSKPFGHKDKIINPLTNKRIKDKKVKLTEKYKLEKTAKKEEKATEFRKKSIKRKISRIKDNKVIKKKQNEQDPNINNEMKFLSKLKNNVEVKSNKKIVQTKNKRKKWCD